MARVEMRKGVWYARFKDSKGNWKYKSCGKGVIKTQAIQLASEWEADAQLKVRTQPPSSKLSDLLQEYRNVHLHIGIRGLDKAQTTVKREQNALDNFIHYISTRKKMKMKNMSKGLIIDYLNHRKNVDNRSPKTRKEERRVIRNFFKFAVSQKAISFNPTDDIPAPSLVQTRKRFFTNSELNTIFEDTCPIYRAIFEFLYLTGLRSSELCNLRWSDYKPHENLLIVRGSHNKRYSGNKYRHDTEIPTSPKVVNILERQKGMHHEFIFTSAHYQPLRKNQLYKILYTILKRNSINEACVHTFRHTCASHLVQQGVSIYKVSKYLRHSSVKMTEIYAHLQPDSLLDDVSIL